MGEGEGEWAADLDRHPSAPRRSTVITPLTRVEVEKDEGAEEDEEDKVEECGPVLVQLRNPGCVFDEVR